MASVVSVRPRSCIVDARGTPRTAASGCGVRSPDGSGFLQAEPVRPRSVPGGVLGRHSLGCPQEPPSTTSWNLGDWLQALASDSVTPAGTRADLPAK